MLLIEQYPNSFDTPPPPLLFDEFFLPVTINFQIIHFAMQILSANLGNFWLCAGQLFWFGLEILGKSIVLGNRCINICPEKCILSQMRERYNSEIELSKTVYSPG